MWITKLSWVNPSSLKVEKFDKQLQKILGGDALKIMIQMGKKTRFSVNIRKCKIKTKHIRLKIILTFNS